MLVSAEPVVGVASRYCNHDFLYNDTFECCENSNSITIHPDDMELSDAFYVYGATDITIQQRWINPPEEHFHVDLGLALSGPNDHLQFHVCSYNGNL